MGSRVSRRIIPLFVSLFLVSCAGSKSPTGAVALIQAADGTYYSAACLRENGLSGKVDCKYRETASQSKSARGFWSGESSYESSYSYYGSYILYPPSYSEAQFCSWLGLSSRCYSGFGYGSYPGYGWGYTTNYTYGNSGGCDSCLNNPWGGSCGTCMYPNYTPPIVYPIPAPFPDPAPTPAPAPAPAPPAPPVVTPVNTYVPCVGGPKKPSYAFFDLGSANHCAQRIASFGKDCQQYVTVRYCTVNSASLIGTIYPTNCVCSPKKEPVGHW